MLKNILKFLTLLDRTHKKHNTNTNNDKKIKVLFFNILL